MDALGGFFVVGDGSNPKQPIWLTDGENDLFVGKFQAYILGENVGEGWEGENA